MKQIYCDLCNSIIKTDYKKFKAKVKDIKKDSNKYKWEYKWEKIDVCLNCYNELFPPTPQFTVELDKVSNSTIERIITGQGLEPINDISYTGIRID